MNKYLLAVILFFLVAYAHGQALKRKSLEELTVTKDPAWVPVQQWIKDAKNKVEVLSKEKQRAEKALLEAQVSTRSSLGAVLFETGGILVDGGWIRILGSGSSKFNRSLMQWNKGKSFKNMGEQPSFLLVADDPIGGFYAINNGALGKADLDKVFYFAPNDLSWQSLGLTYTEFLDFCFSADIDKFYKGLRWKDWHKDVALLSADKGFTFYPYLWTKEGKEINKNKKEVVPMDELWKVFFDLKK